MRHFFTWVIWVLVLQGTLIPGVTVAGASSTSSPMTMSSGTETTREKSSILQRIGNGLSRRREALERIRSESNQTAFYNQSLLEESIQIQGDDDSRTEVMMSRRRSNEKKSGMSRWFTGRLSKKETLNLSSSVDPNVSKEEKELIIIPPLQEGSSSSSTGPKFFWKGLVRSRDTVEKNGGNDKDDNCDSEEATSETSPMDIDMISNNEEDTSAVVKTKGTLFRYLFNLKIDEDRDTYLRKEKGRDAMLPTVENREGTPQDPSPVMSDVETENEDMNEQAAIESKDDEAVGEQSSLLKEREGERQGFNFLWRMVVVRSRDSEQSDKIVSEQLFHEESKQDVMISDTSKMEDVVEEEEDVEEEEKEEENHEHKLDNDGAQDERLSIQDTTSPDETNSDSGDSMDEHKDSDHDSQVTPSLAMSNSGMEKNHTLDDSVSYSGEMITGEDSDLDDASNSQDVIFNNNKDSVGHVVQDPSEDAAFTHANVMENYNNGNETTYNPCRDDDDDDFKDEIPQKRFSKVSFFSLSHRKKRGQSKAQRESEAENESRIVVSRDERNVTDSETSTYMGDGDANVDTDTTESANALVVQHEELNEDDKNVDRSKTAVHGMEKVDDHKIIEVSKLVDSSSGCPKVDGHDSGNHTQSETSKSEITENNVYLESVCAPKEEPKGREQNNDDSKNMKASTEAKRHHDTGVCEDEKKRSALMRSIHNALPWLEKDERTEDEKFVNSTKDSAPHVAVQKNATSSAPIMQNDQTSSPPSSLIFLSPPPLLRNSVGYPRGMPQPTTETSLTGLLNILFPLLSRLLLLTILSSSALFGFGESNIYSPEPTQHFMLERINHRYEKDSLALKKALESPPVKVSKYSWTKEKNKRKAQLKKIFACDENGENEPNRKKVNESFSRTVIVMDVHTVDRDMEDVVAELRDAVSFILSQYNEVNTRINMGRELEVIVCIESPGGVVQDFGLAADQLARLKHVGSKKQDLILTVCVDKIAASGGYMMACQASPGKLLAAPFAVLGSIGVLRETLNIHDVLQKYGVQPLVLKAGDAKVPLTQTTKVTKESIAIVQKNLERAHDAFRDMVAKARGEVIVENFDDVTNGDIFLGKDAARNGLVDQLMTSDEYIAQKVETGDRVLKLHKYDRSRMGLRLSPLDLLLLRSNGLLGKNYSQHKKHFTHVATKCMKVAISLGFIKALERTFRIQSSSTYSYYP